MITSLDFEIGGGSLHVNRYGQGPVPVLCFHGYGESANSFSFLSASSEYSFYAIDLPWHGSTDWNKKDFDSNDLVTLAEKILGKDPGHPPVLLGFSLGGRVALSLFEKWDRPIHKLILLAPDGLKVNFWYRLATQSRIGRALFRFTMKHPSWFFWMLRAGNALKLVNSSIFKFVKYYIGDEQVRNLLYKRWTGFAKLKPSVPGIKNKISTTHTHVTLLYGKHDRIILPVVGQKFAKGIEKYCSISVVDSGHQLLHAKHASQILAALNAPVD